MRARTLLLTIPWLLSACRNGPDRPDVSHVKVDLQTVRYEQAFFALDTLDIGGGLRRLRATHPGFTDLYLGQILGIPPGDSSPAAFDACRRFLRDYRPILAMADKAVGDLADVEGALEEALRRVKYHFPRYETPGRLYTFIGPMDAIATGRTAAYGDIITPQGLGVGLQLHLGADAPLYTSQEGQALYPRYLSRRFDPAYITVNCVKNVVDDLFPGRPDDRTLLDHMVDKGKRLHLLDLFLPDAADTLKTGYTAAQLEGVAAHEGLVWDHLVASQLVHSSDLPRIRPYLSEGPMTPELGEGSPGYVGLFTGRQIVRAYLARHPETGLQALLDMSARDILEGARYKPR
jgi:hypothetical protein